MKIFTGTTKVQAEQTVTTVISGSGKVNYHDGLKSAVFEIGP